MLQRLAVCLLIVASHATGAFEVKIINKTGFDIQVSRVMPPLNVHAKGEQGKIIGKTKTLSANKAITFKAKYHGLADITLKGVFHGRHIGPQSLYHSASKTGFTGKQTFEVHYSDKLKKFYYK
ncbi:hypothetical protein Noda2021_10480 [Candidatus Dependentiae bacterium Noda2021]|nr:hypothetical protein Noda2021_10480 [Candidatus Dependentiae bacterium Noda2021]